MENYINKEVSDALAKEMTEKIVGQIRTRVPYGKKFWFIRNDGRINYGLEYEDLYCKDLFDCGNYFHTEEEAESMVRKIHAVLNGADVIEMPSEEEMLNSIPSDWSSEQYMSGAGIGWHRCYDWLKTKCIR